MKDWLLLAAGVAAVFAAAGCQACCAGRGVSRAAGTVWRGLLLAYVLDIPTRFCAKALWRQARRAMAVSYALFRCAGAAGGARRPAARAERDDLCRAARRV